jgi:hypothetical protein
MTPPLGRLRHWQRSALAAIAVLALVLPAALALAGLGEVADDELPLHFYHASLSEGSGLLQEERVSTIEKPVYIPLDERQDTERKRASAFRLAFTHLSPRKSRFILPAVVLHRCRGAVRPGRPHLDHCRRVRQFVRLQNRLLDGRRGKSSFSGAAVRGDMNSWLTRNTTLDQKW